MFCENCGSQVPDNASFCTECGAQIVKKSAAPIQPPQPAATAQNKTPSYQPQTPVNQAPVHQAPLSPTTAHKAYDYSQAAQPAQRSAAGQGARPAQYTPPVQGQPPVQVQPPVVQKQTVYTRKLPIIMIILLTLGFFGVGLMGGIGGIGLSMAVATIPGLILLVLIYRLDRIEPEPVGLLVKLFVLGGTVVVIAAVIVSTVLDMILGSVFPADSFAYCLLDAFIVAALVEETLKFMILKKVTWKHPAFNYRFDGVVYSTTVAIGFEVVEDLLYMIGSADGNAFLRAAFPGHCIFAIYMGYYYGQAKTFELNGDPAKAKAMRRKGIFTAVGLHGLYDFCCMYAQYASELVAALLVLAMVLLMVILNVVSYKNIKKYAQEDTEV